MGTHAEQKLATFYLGTNKEYVEHILGVHSTDAVVTTKTELDLSHWPQQETDPSSWTATPESAGGGSP